MGKSTNNADCVSRRILTKVLFDKRANFRNIVRVTDICNELNDIGQSSVRLGKNSLQVLNSELALGLEIFRAKNISMFITSNLPSAED